MRTSYARLPVQSFYIAGIFFSNALNFSEIFEISRKYEDAVMIRKSRNHRESLVQETQLFLPIDF